MQRTDDAVHVDTGARVMEWVKLYTDFHDHRKVAELDPTAGFLWVLCFSWSGANETDGFVPTPVARRFLSGEIGDEAAARLVRVGLWEKVKGGYRMHDWGGRQRTRDQLAEVRAKRAVAGQRGGLAKGKQTASNLLGNVPSKTEAKSQQPPGMVPSKNLAESEIERETDSPTPPSPPPTPGIEMEVDLAGSSRAWLPADDERDSALVYMDAYRASHGGKEAPRPLLADMVSVAGLCVEGGTPAEDVHRALVICARTNRNRWQFQTVLAEVQGGEPAAPPGRGGRADRSAEIRRAWEERHCGGYE